MQPEHYLALGDSISIDIYPATDADRRYHGRASTDRLGAASLFYRNDDRLWPEFRARDLNTLLPKLKYDYATDDLTADGATTHSLLRQVERVEPSDAATLATITIGGNDLLGNLGFRSSEDPVAEIADRARDAVARLLELRPNVLLLLGTVYDPSDGTNRLPGYPRTLDTEAEWLRRYNDEMRNLASSDERIRLADIHQHFLGHGLSAPVEEQWYLRESIIEPNARGASEVRRVWLEALPSS